MEASRTTQMRRDKRKSLSMPDDSDIDSSVETNFSTGSAEASQSWQQIRPRNAIDYCLGLEDQAAVLRSFGVQVWLSKTRIINPHFLGAATRTVIEQREAEHKYMHVAKAVVICDPRENEVELFREHILSGPKELRRMARHVCGRRDSLHGVDLAERREVLEVPSAISALTPKLFIFNDNAYWHTPETLFTTYLSNEFDREPEGKVYALVSLYDFRGEGECLFLHRYRLGGKEKRLAKMPGRVGEGPVTYEDVVIPKQEPIDLIEGYAWKNVDGEIQFHGSCSDFGGETRYEHGWAADAFFENSVYLFHFNGQEFKATMHVETRVGYKTLINVCYTRAHPGDVSVENDAVPKVGFIENGIIPSLLSKLRVKARTTDEQLTSSVRVFFRDAQAIFERLLPEQIARHLLASPEWAQKIDAAVIATATLALYEPRPDLSPPPGFMHKNVATATSKARAMHLVEKTGMSLEMAEPIVALQVDQTRVGLVVELFRLMKQAGIELIAKVRELFARLRVFARHAWAPEVELDMARLIHRLFRKAPLLHVTVRKMESAVASWSWLNNWRAKVIDLSKAHPVLFNVFSVVINSSVLLFRAFLEESAKRIASPIFFIWSLMESLLEFIDWYFTESHERISILTVVRNVFLRLLAHLILTIIPLPVAVILHAMWNWRVQAKQRSFLEDLRIALRCVDADSVYGEDWNITPVDNYDIQLRDLPASLLVKEGDQYVPVIDRPELFEEARQVKYNPRKITMLKCTATLHFQRPPGDLVSLALMIHNRLDKPIFVQPKPGNVHRGYLIAYRLCLGERVSQVEPLSPQEFVKYIEGQGFSASKVALYLQRIAAGETVAGPKEKIQEMVGKRDEILPASSALASGVVPKMRPIFPIDECDIDFMRWLLPFKERFGDPFEFTVRGHLFSFTYMLNTRADFLDEWVNTRAYQDGIHVIALGDDNYTLYVDHKSGRFGPDALASAFDLTMCDRTCGKDVQACFLSYCRDCGLSSYESERFWKRCSGLRKVVPHGRPELSKIEEKVEFFYLQREKCTVTGNPATSIQAVFAQLCFKIMAFEEWVYDGVHEPETYGKSVDRCGTNNGHILEWEMRDPQREAYFSKLHLRTFLGGRFIFDQKDENIKWCPDHILKSAMIAPDTEQIYGGPDHVYRHVAAVSCDQGLLRTPIGRAICERYRALATKSGLDEEDFKAAVAALTRSKSWYQKLKVMEFKLAPIDDDSWFEATREFNICSGFPDPFPELQDLMSELLTINCLPFRLENSCMSLYYTRFGKPKVRSESLMLDLWTKIQILSGNRELRSLITQLPFMPRGQKKKETKEVKKVVRELANVAKEDKLDRSRSKAKGKRTQAAREFDGAYRVAKQSIPYGASSAKSISRKFQASYIERQAYKYLVGLLNPTIPDMPGSPHGLPPGVQTMRWQVPIRGTVVANASGFAFIQLNADSWKADDTQYNPLLPDSNVRFLAFAGNLNPVVYSTAAYVGTTTPAPANGALPFPAGLAGDNPGGPGATVATIMPGANAAGLNLKYRFVSGELAVQPITSALVQQGSIVAYRKIYVDEALAGLSFNNNTYDAIAGLPPSVAEVREQSIVEWPHGTWMRIPLIPSGSVGDYLLFPEQGLANRWVINDADVGFVLSGGAANQALRFEVTLNYESTVIPGFLASTYGNHPPIMVQEGEVPATSLLSMNDRKLIKQVDEAVGVDTDGAMAAMATHKALQEPAAANSSWLSDVVDGVGKVAPYVAEAASFIAALL